MSHNIIWETPFIAYTTVYFVDHKVSENEKDFPLCTRGVA